MQELNAAVIVGEYIILDVRKETESTMTEGPGTAFSA